jgi:hypothetical protein
VACRGLQDRPDEGGALGGEVGEEFFAGVDVGGGEVPSGVGDADPGPGGFGEAEQFGGVDQGQEVVDLEAERVSDLGQAGFAAAGGEDFQQAGHAADADRRQWRLDGRGWRFGFGAAAFHGRRGGLFAAGEDA